MSADIIITGMIMGGFIWITAMILTYFRWYYERERSRY